MEGKLNFDGGDVLFREPVTIKCLVHGKKMMAKIMGETANSLTPSFLLEFSDGTSFEAMWPEDSEYWHPARPKYWNYVFGIQDALTDFFSVYYTNWYKFEIHANAQDLLIWVGEDTITDFSFTVHYNGSYQFSLRQANEIWEAASLRDEKEILDESIVNKVINELKQKVTSAL